MVAGRIGDGNTVGAMVRMPSDLRDRVKAAADESGRSMNSEIVATLEEAYPAPERRFNIDKWNEHKAKVEKRSAEILAGMKAIVLRYDEPEADPAVLSAEFSELSEAHKKLWDYNIEDDQFHDIETADRPKK
tara:strand:+ start:763 stop:1158 length:396 start_codon:yes stop_codon:yes gene_type:complete